MSDLIIVDDSNFDAEVFGANGVILVKLGATWCSPCTRQTPIVEKFATENPDVKVYQADIDDCPAICAKYSIRSVPTLLLFKDGTCLAMKTGLTSLKDIEDMVFNDIEEGN